jgi:hypothetical protein
MGCGSVRKSMECRMLETGIEQYKKTHEFSSFDMPNGGCCPAKQSASNVLASKRCRILNLEGSKGVVLGILAPVAYHVCSSLYCMATVSLVSMALETKTLQYAADKEAADEEKQAETVPDFSKASASEPLVPE